MNSQRPVHSERDEPLSSGTPVTIHEAPGFKLRCLASWIFSQQTFENVFEEILTDLLLEYLEALNQGQVWRAHWVRTRGYTNFWQAAGMQVFSSFSKALTRARRLVR